MDDVLNLRGLYSGDADALKGGTELKNLGEDITAGKVTIPVVKALRLLRKSNPPLLEWMKSPMVYHRDPDFTREFEELAGMFYSPRRCFAHYLHMASGNWKSYLEGRDQVSLKKYLYVLRPLLACRWIERSLG